MRLIASLTTLCASAFGSDGRLRLPRFFPFGHPPSFAFSLAASALASDFTLPSSAPILISFPQCGHFIAHQNTRLFAIFHGVFQSSPLPEKVTVRIRVRLEPQLEKHIATLDASERRQVAKKFERWAHQLKISAAILDRACPAPPQDPLRPLPRRRLLLN